MGTTVRIREGPDFVMNLDVYEAVDRESANPLRESQWRGIVRILRASKDDNPGLVDTVREILKSRLESDRAVLELRTESMKRAPHVAWRRSAMKSAEYQVSRTKKFIKILEDEINGKSNHS